MARIKIKDIPKEKKISKKEMKRVMGGSYYSTQGVIINNSHYVNPWGVIINNSHMPTYW